MAEHDYRFPMAHKTCADGFGAIVASLFLREPDKLPQRFGPVHIGKEPPDDVPAMLTELIRLLPTEQRKYVGAVALHRLCEKLIHKRVAVTEALGVVAFVNEGAVGLPYRPSKEKLVNGFGKAQINLQATGAVWPVIYPQLSLNEVARHPSQIKPASAAPEENGLWVVVRGVPSEVEMRPLPIMTEAA